MTIVNPLSLHKEDISTLAAGTVLFGSPCVVSNITVSLETTGTAIVNFSDTSTAYSSASRNFKVVIDGPGTVPIVFPNGKVMSAGWCAQSNLASVDISLDYE